MDAINLMTDLAKLDIEGNKCYAIVTLNVKNAFNSVMWKEIIEASAGLGAAMYLIMYCSRASTRFFCDLDECSKENRTTCGTPQGSVPGPSWWNIMSSAVLAIIFIEFANDIRLTIVASHVKNVKKYTRRKQSGR